MTRCIGLVSEGEKAIKVIVGRSMSGNADDHVWLAHDWLVWRRLLLSNTSSY